MYLQRLFLLISGPRGGKGGVQECRIQVFNPSHRSSSNRTEHPGESRTNSGTSRIIWMWEIYYNSAAAKILRSSIGVCGKI